MTQSQPERVYEIYLDTLDLFTCTAPDDEAAVEAAKREVRRHRRYLLKHYSGTMSILYPEPYEEVGAVEIEVCRESDGSLVWNGFAPLAAV